MSSGTHERGDDHPHQRRPPGEATHATIDGATIARHPGEPIDEFEAQVMAAARAGLVVIIGGLPEGE